MKVFPAAGLLGVALLAIYVGSALSAPAPTNCMLESMGVDTGSLGKNLNVILSIVIQLLYSQDDPCKMKELAGELDGAMKDMECMMDGMSPEAKPVMQGLLGGLLDAVGKLLEALLGSNGVLGAVGDLLTTIVNLVVCLLKSLGLEIDLDVMLKLGNLLNLNISALLNLL